MRLLLQQPLLLWVVALLLVGKRERSVWDKKGKKHNKGTERDGEELGKRG